MLQYANSIKMTINHLTWGKSSQASIDLANILNERNDAKLTKKVNNYVHNYRIHENSLNGLDKQNRKYFMEMLLHDTLQKINDHFDEEIKSFLSNVIKGFYRDKIRFIYGKIK